MNRKLFDDAIRKEYILTNKYDDYLQDGYYKNYFKDDENSIYKHCLFDIEFDDNLRSRYGKREMNQTHSIYGTWTKMLSLASSSRLCFIYFKDLYKAQQVELEASIDLGFGVTSQPDAYQYLNGKHVYYECKCHEIIPGKFDEISKKECIGLSNKYFNEEYLKDNFPKDFIDLMKSGLNNEGKVNFQNLDMDFARLPCLYIDLKQLFTHLYGLMKLSKENPDNEYVLQYIFFRPTSKDFNYIYEQINQEFNIVINSKLEPILKNNNIAIKEPKFISIKEILAKEII